MSQVRDAIRAKIFAEKIRSQVVTLPGDTEGAGGVEIEIRQPTVGQMLDAVKEADPKHQIVRMIINSCYIPGTQDKVFEESDYDALLDLPTDGTYRILFNTINSMTLDKEVEAAGKVSSEETSVSS